MKNFCRKHPQLLWMLPTVLVLVVIVVAFRMFVPTYFVGSGSMGETLPVRTLIFLGPATDLEPRDVITFQKEGDDRPTTHTFIGYAEDGSLMTKGDANPTPDLHEPPLTIDDVKGEVVYKLTLRRQFALVALVVLALYLVLGGSRPEEESDPKEQSNPTDTPRVTNPA